jgi:hypothetical protein
MGIPNFEVTRGLQDRPTRCQSSCSRENVRGSGSSCAQLSRFATTIASEIHDRPNCRGCNARNPCRLSTAWTTCAESRSISRRALPRDHPQRMACGSDRFRSRQRTPATRIRPDRALAHPATGLPTRFSLTQRSSSRLPAMGPLLSAWFRGYAAPLAAEKGRSSGECRLAGNVLRRPDKDPPKDALKKSKGRIPTTWIPNIQRVQVGPAATCFAAAPPR